MSLARRPAAHGDRLNYQRGCRCAACRSANTATQKARRDKLRATGKLKRLKSQIKAEQRYELKRKMRRRTFLHPAFKVLGVRRHLLDY